jgi:hypothetical protein
VGKPAGYIFLERRKRMYALIKVKDSLRDMTAIQYEDENDAVDEMLRQYRECLQARQRAYGGMYIIRHDNFDNTAYVRVEDHSFSEESNVNVIRTDHWNVVELENP